MKRSVLVLLLMLSPSLAAAEGSTGKEELRKYELKLIYIFENPKTEYMFVIGDSGFRSVESLKRFLAMAPAGSEVVWAPGCERLGGEPLLSSEHELEEFRAFLKSHGLKFTLVPSG